MKLPLSWLATFVDLPDGPVADLAETMGRFGLEVDAIDTPGAGVTGTSTARVESWAPHPDADRLRVVTITHGDDVVELVCGASNFDTGDVVVHAGVGGSIPGMTLEARELRGVVSNGMLCSARELQLGEDHDGIMVLDPDTPLGVDVHDVLPLGEPVIDLEVKGARGDVLSVLGAARDLAAVLDTDLRAPDPSLPDVGDDAVDVVIDAPEGCTHFVALTLDDVTVPDASPWWLRQRLAQVGVRAISPLVDITNYVMMELGQPMHAYDADELDGDLRVRWANEGEHLTTLDDVDRALSTRDLVVADAAGPVGLAGVMGGEATEVTPRTRRLVLEAAVWDPGTIRHTARSLRLTSEASLRFERGVDPAGARRAVARAWELLAAIGTATPVGLAEAGAPVDRRPSVEVDPARVNGLLGLSLDADEQAALLARASVGTERDGDALVVTPPSWRGDLTRMADVAEEVARLHGYDRIPAELPPILQRGGLRADQQAERDLRTVATAFGLDEVVTRPFVGDDHLAGTVPSDGLVVLANPLAKDAHAMRPSLLEGLLGVVRRNVGQSRPGVAVFEVGRIFRPAGDALDDVMDALEPDGADELPGDLAEWRWRLPDDSLLPTQPKAIGVALQGRRTAPGRLDDVTWSAQDALAVFDEVVRRLGHEPDELVLDRVPVERAGLHPYRTVAMQVRAGDGAPVEVGVVGQLHPTEAARRDLPEPVVVGELVVEPFLRALAAGRRPTTTAALVTRPTMIVDVAVEAPDEVAWADLAAAVRDTVGELLVDLKVFDVYRGDPLPEGHRSIAARLWLQAADRALTGDDEARVLDGVEAAVADAGGRMRR
ncbi:phenylalanine--tRNA ligase subunit beta [Salsipaludibacter albus]|uniref:phenylalanine--tRNA ligase subunit beta n=1 Tax=Salsipaludibacter albus TaxID=2849650 RepID=UPI001EE4A645|nr:phenylalanine--tRNA ligase subunit beta [Salsipaludibacter albus]MBY5163790.1 phenylalanine--tRNA ligase subunit beta [Salsipaludibacter albus]